MHTAALLGHEKIVELLLADQRVNVNCRDLGGHTPLHLAAGCGYDEVVQLLRDCDRVEVACENKSGTVVQFNWSYRGLSSIETTPQLAQVYETI